MYNLSGNVQTHTIEGLSVDFQTKTYTEFMRFRNLAGEQAIIADVLRSLQSNDIVYDIGANVGTYTCFVASKLKSGQTIAFEPEPQNTEALRENLKLNDLNVEVIEIALSDTDGTVDFALGGTEAGEGEHAIATSDYKDTIEVETDRGDSVIDHCNLPHPTVLKIDVEGSELSVLRGLSDTLREHVRVIYVEVHPEKILDFGGSESEIRDFLEETGFEVRTIDSRGSEYFWRASK